MGRESLVGSEKGMIPRKIQIFNFVAPRLSTIELTTNQEQDISHNAT